MLRQAAAQLGKPVLIGAAALWLSLPALAAPAASLLADLKLPAGTRLAHLFAANAIGQTSLNGQVAQTPEGLLSAVRSSLEQQGYRERTINTVSGAWGFNLVMEPPADVQVDGTQPGKTAALVVQSTALGPGKLNLNIRFEGL